ncbi:MAG: serine/threonine-protein phosphatase [Eubacterium sp.]|nr:serine/threonine-protein phosphatase [Eubacterium sp.]
MNRIFISAYAASNVGKRRQNNEDNYYLNGNYVNSSNVAFVELSNSNDLITSVCDGMGGEEAGEVASQIAVETLNKCYKYLLDTNLSDVAIEKYVNYSNDLICDEISKCKKRMGTTYTLLGIKDGVATASNIGDSRIYKYSNGMLEQISRDHTEAQSMVDAGIISAEESMKIPEKHRLTQHLGIFPYEMVIEPYTVRFPVSIGDRYLLCSDGLTDMLTNAEISAILSKKQSLKSIVDELISTALENGGKDNVTIILCEIIGDNTETVIQNDDELNRSVSNFNNKSEASKDVLIKAFDIEEKALKSQIDVSYNDTVAGNNFNTPKKKNKMFLLIIFLVVLGLVIGSFFAGKTYQKNYDEKSITSTETATAEAETKIYNESKSTELTNI